MRTEEEPEGKEIREARERELHRQGDEQADVANSYERLCRCSWMLKLRRTNDTISKEHEEDCTLTKPDGTKAYRQVKKKDDRGLWQFHDDRFPQFVRRAYNRFLENNTCRHDFYTNGEFSDRLLVKKNNTELLQPQHPRIKQIAQENTEQFCDSVTLHSRYLSIDPGATEFLLAQEIERIIKRELVPGALNELRIPRRSEIVMRLIAAERTLLAKGRVVSWADVNKEARLDDLIDEIRTYVLSQRAFIPWREVAQDAGRWLPPDAVGSIAQPQFPRPVEREACEVATDLLTALKQDSRPRLLILVGKHGTGKTWVLMRVAQHLIQESEGLEVLVASGPLDECLNKLPSLDLAYPGPRAVFIDDLFDEAAPILSDVGRLLVPPRTLFVCATSCEENAREVSDLKQRFRDRARVVPLPSTLNKQELSDLALFLRGVPPTRNEERRALRTNIRHAHEYLRRRKIPRHLSKLQLLLEQDEYAQALAPVLFCSVLDIGVPTPLLDRYLGRRLRSKFRRWVVTVKRRIGDLTFFEDMEEANRLLEETYGHDSARAALECYQKLLAESDPLKTDERAFVRNLLSRLARTDRKLVCDLVVSNRELIRRLLGEEPPWALAFSWLPTFGFVLRELRKAPNRGFAASEAGLRHVLDAAVQAFASEAPKNSAEFSLWMQAYDTGTAVRYLHGRMQLVGDWDVVLIVRMALMIRGLPEKEQPSVGGNFCHLLSNLPEKFRECLPHGNNFELLTRLMAEHGGPFDREKALTLAGDVLTERVREAGSGPRGWVESYNTLVKRVFMQERNGLALEILRGLVIGELAHVKSFDDMVKKVIGPRRSNLALEIARVVSAGNEPNRVKQLYGKCLDRESGVKPSWEWLELMLEEGLKSLREFAPILRDQDLPIGTDDVPQRIRFPGNLLELAAQWADEFGWQRLADKYLSTLEEPGVQKLPFNLLAPLVLPGFEAMRRGPKKYWERFLRAVMAWVPSESTLPSEELTQFVFKLLKFVIVQKWLEDDPRSSARKALVCLFTDPDKGRENARRLLEMLQQQITGSRREIDASLGLEPNWHESSGCATTYLSQFSNIELPSEEAPQLASRIIEQWAMRDKLCFAVSTALLRLRRTEQAAPFVKKLIEASLNMPDSYAIAAVAEARQGHIDDAYLNLLEVVSYYAAHRRGVHLWVAHWVHEELGRVTTGPTQRLHRVCAELTAARRLQPYDDLFRGADAA